MKSPKYFNVFFILFLCSFSVRSVLAENRWMEPTKETIQKLYVARLQVTITQRTHLLSPTTIQNSKINQNLMLAQLNTLDERKREAERAEQADIKRLEILKKKIEQRKQAKREKKEADKKKAHKQKLKEEARLKEIHRLKLEDEARLKANLKKANEKKLKEEARLKEVRRLKLENEARLKAENDVRLKAENKIKQELQAKKDKKRVAQFIKMKKITDHPCSQYDVNNKKQVMSCMQALEKVRVKKDRDLWLDTGTCKHMQEALGAQLKLMGFWKSAIDERTPDCKMFAYLHEEKFGNDVYWSKCVEGPKNDAQYVFNCLNFGKATSLSASVSTYAKTYRTNLEDAGFDVGIEVEHRNQRDFWNPVIMLVKEQISENRIKRKKQNQKLLYNLYYAKTPEREKSKYSDLERKMMKDGKLKVPSEYAAPTSNEIRLAVMRSIAIRANGGNGGESDDFFSKVLKSYIHVGSPVITDGVTIYLPREMPASVAMKIVFGDVQNVRCSKRSSDGGYMCQYKLNTSAEADFLNHNKRRSYGNLAKFGSDATIDRMSVQYMSRVENYNNWFILTETGWRQPHTYRQIKEFRQHKTSTLQSIQQQQQNQSRNNTSLLYEALQGVNNANRFRGANAALNLRWLW